MDSLPPIRPVRIGNAMGAVTDLSENMSVLAQRKDIDFIVGDWMSEYNMASRGSMKASMHSGVEDTEMAFEANFLESIEPCLGNVAANGIRLAVNAGACDTEKLYHQVVERIAQQSLELKVAWVEGDEVHDVIEKSRKEGVKFRNITTGKFHLACSRRVDADIRKGQQLDSWEFDPIYAQCYLGSWGIVESFRAGADIVICGRVADAAPTMAAAAFWHNWSRDSYVQLAHALIAGHLIECSFYITGGNYDGFKTMNRSSTPLLSLPIATIQNDGTFYVGMDDRPDRGGEVSLNTCRSQLLYELQGKRYYNSDVVAIVDEIKMEQAGPNSVYVHNVGFEKPPPTTKVGITAKGGYQAEVHYYMTGLDIEEKAKMLEEQLRYCLDTKSFSKLTFTTTGSCATNPESQDAATVNFRIFAQSRSLEAISPPRFLKPCLNMVMSAYPGATFGMEQRHGFPKPYYEYFVTILPLNQVRHIAHIPFSGRDQMIDPPTDTVPYLFEQETNQGASPLPLDSFGPTSNVPLGYTVHARSGDKGSDANIGFFVSEADEYDWLRSLLTTEYLKVLLQNSYTGGRIERFELPNIRCTFGNPLCPPTPANQQANLCHPSCSFPT